MKVYDYKCPKCGLTLENFMVEDHEINKVFCWCGKKMTRLFPLKINFDSYFKGSHKEEYKK